MRRGLDGRVCWSGEKRLVKSLFSMDGCMVGDCLDGEERRVSVDLFFYIYSCKLSYVS